MKKIYALYTLCMSLFSLDGFTQTTPENRVTNNTSQKLIIVVFNNVPHYPQEVRISQRFNVLNTNPIIAYYDGYLKKEFSPKQLQQDTLKIAPKYGYVRIRHSFNTIAAMDYLCKLGDTLVFDYPNGIPHASLINERNTPMDAAFENVARSRAVLLAGLTPFEIYNTPYFTQDSIAPDMVFNYRYKIKAHNYLLAKQQFAQEMILLDSLKNSHQISDACYRFYTDRAIYLTKTMSIEQADSKSNVSLEVPNGDYFTDGYSFFNDYIQAYAFGILEKKAKTIYQSNGQIADYRQVFDQVTDLKKVVQVFKNNLLHKYFILIADNFSKKDFEQYYKKAQSQITDTMLLNDIAQRYITAIYRNNNQTSLTFMNNQKEVISLTNLLESNKNKVIYIDFWASWCLPCRAAMPNSIKLRKEFANKGVVFVYLSTDSDFTKWQKAATEEGLNNYEQSFIVMQLGESSFVKSIKLNSIPRYLLYNKKGILYNQHAPSPNNRVALKRLLNELLK